MTKKNKDKKNKEAIITLKGEDVESLAIELEKNLKGSLPKGIEIDIQLPKKDKK